MQAKLTDLDNAFIGLWKHKRGFPNFKSRKHSVQGMRYRKDLVKILGPSKIKLPKLGIIKYKGKIIDGKLVNGTIKMRSFGRVDLVLCYEQEYKILLPKGVIGIDINCHNITDNNGMKYNIPAYNYQDKIRKWQKALSRRVKDSNNWQKAKNNLAKWHFKASNKRRDVAHKISNKISCPSENQARRVILEDINLQNLTRKGKHKRGLNRSLLDSCLGEIRQKLEYKSAAVHKLDKFYPSSKLCNVCGYKNQLLTLSDRQWSCIICTTQHDRDINAAKNILNKWLEDSPIYIFWGGAVRPRIIQAPTIYLWWDSLLVRGNPVEARSSQ